jgi:hypothetical protein
MQRLRSLFAPVAVIGMAHVVGGVAALFAAGAAHVSGLAGLTMLGLWPGFTALLLIIVGLMAICSRMCPHSREWVNTLVAPQQLVLMIQLGGVMIAVYHGAYPDGYKPADDWWGSMWFILADQSPLIAMCLSHTIELALGGLVDAEREYYQRELKETQRALDSCNRCWQMQREAKFWDDLGQGPIAGPNISERAE